MNAQTADDEFMLRKHEILSGVSYSHDSWDQYWEGPFKRTNGNLGTVTTQTAAWATNYGVSDRLNVMASVPYAWTRASQGVLSAMEGFQDLTMAAKYRLVETSVAGHGSMRAMAAVSASVPLSDYTPDFLPLSIGSASKRVSGRLIVNYRGEPGWFVNGSAAYTRREKVELDRPYYYTEGRLFLTDEVALPDVFDYSLGAGYAKHPFMASLFFSEQRTQGGGDIRRQDMPFVSNRMDFSRVGLGLMYALPKLRGLELRFMYAYTIDGRNVGQAVTVTTGLTYRFGSDGRSPQ